MYDVYNKTICLKCAGKSLGKYISLHGVKCVCSYYSQILVSISIENIIPVLTKHWELYNSDVNCAMAFSSGSITNSLTKSN